MRDYSSSVEHVCDIRMLKAADFLENQESTVESFSSGVKVARRCERLRFFMATDGSIALSLAKRMSLMVLLSFEYGFV